MKTVMDMWPVISAVLNLVSLVALRLISQQQKSTQDAMTIAILKLKEELRDDYASGQALEKLEADLRRDINLAGRIDAGFDRTAKLVIKHGNHGMQVPQS